MFHPSVKGHRRDKNVRGFEVSKTKDGNSSSYRRQTRHFSIKKKQITRLSCFDEVIDGHPIITVEYFFFKWGNFLIDPQTVDFSSSVKRTDIVKMLVILIVIIYLYFLPDLTRSTSFPVFTDTSLRNIISYFRPSHIVPHPCR